MNLLVQSIVLCDLFDLLTTAVISIYSTVLCEK
jgi:hypothetical protein